MNWNELKEKYKNNKTELLLFLLFLCFFAVIAAPDLVREASSGKVVSETEALTEDNTETQSEPETESEEETQAGTEAPLLTEKEQRNLSARLGREFQIPMAMPEEETELSLPELAKPGRLKQYQVDRPQPEPEEGREPEAGTGRAESMEALQTALEEQLSGYDGEWSVYVKNLSSGESLLIHDQPMKSASVMKLFIMGTVYKAFESGELERTDEVMALMNDMISYSDNAASNDLLYRLGESSYEAGIAKVNEFIDEYGFSDMTVEYNGFSDPATNTGTGNYNQVTAEDCGKLLEDIYRRKWVSREVSLEIEEMMLNQNTRYKIPAGLPEGVLCGNKTGEMDSTQNDAAIVYSDACDYILVVLSSDWSSSDQAISRIADLSSEVYSFFNAE